MGQDLERTQHNWDEVTLNTQFPLDCRLVFRYKGTVSTRNDLPERGEVGDVFQVDRWRIDQNNTLFCVHVVWDGEQWIKVDPITVD